MMRAKFTLPCVLVALCVIVILIVQNYPTAREISRIQADLDGDGKPEVITLSDTSIKNTDSNEYSVRVSDATYKSERGITGRVDPIATVVSISVVQIDRSSPRKQILIRGIEETHIEYRLLAFSQRRLSLLLSAASVVEPKIVGNGHVETGQGEGFWVRFDRYAMNPGGTKLVLEKQTRYPVEIEATAAKALALGLAGCAISTFAEGDRLTIKSYDILQKRYLLLGKGSTCGWIPEQEVTYENISGLSFFG